ncbi:MAG: hypothetical protein AB7P14_14190 [Blastocatellales bacterium]
MKKTLIIIALALFAGLFVLGLGRDEPLASNLSNGPSFELNVVKPRIARPLFGMLPAKPEEKLEGTNQREGGSTTQAPTPGSAASDTTISNSAPTAGLFSSRQMTKWKSRRVHLLSTREKSWKSSECCVAAQPIS